MKLDEFSTTTLTAGLDSTERVRFVSFGFDIASGAPIPVFVPAISGGYTRDWGPWRDVARPKKKRRKKAKPVPAPTPPPAPIRIPDTAYREFLRRVSTARREAPATMAREVAVAIDKVTAKTPRAPELTAAQEEAVIEAATKSVEAAELELLEILSL